jgi:excisionase family DNA binding protein
MTVDTSTIERVPFAEAVRILGVADSTLRRWTKRGSIACYRVGKLLSYSTAELERISCEHPRRVG